MKRTSIQCLLKYLGKYTLLNLIGCLTHTNGQYQDRRTQKCLVRSREFELDDFCNYFTPGSKTEYFAGGKDGIKKIH